jgi:Mg-chelatase subunit ChlD
MKKKQQVHNLIILDESGSMGSIKTTIIQGFNEIVQTVKGIQLQFPEQQHYISLITFNGLGQKILHFMDPIEKLDCIDDTRYNPDASTPLFDAMGFGLSKIKQALQFVPDYNVLVTILTDGEENASKEYSGEAVKKLIEELKLKKWTFTYIGTDHDVEKIALTLSITNTMTFKKNESDIKKMFASEQNARLAYSNKIRMKEETKDDFYTKD